MMKKLDEIASKQSFKVPENYFEEVNRKIINSTSGYDQETRKTGLSLRLKPYLMVAASITGFIILSYTAIKLFVPEKTNIQVAETFFDDYPELYINDIDILSIEESAASLDIFEELPEVNNSDIIDYLLLENIEINDIYEQF